MNPETDNQNLLEVDQTLETFGHFSRAVPERWRKAPVYICDSLGRYHRAHRLLLVRESDGKKIVVIDHEYSKIKETP